MHVFRRAWAWFVAKLRRESSLPIRVIIGFFVGIALVFIMLPVALVYELVTKLSRDRLGSAARWGIAAVSFMVILAGLNALGERAQVAVASPSATPRPTASPRSTLTPAPTQTPTTVTSGTGDSVARFGSQIPGLTAADVTLNLEDRGFTCEGPTQFIDGVDYICERDTAAYLGSERVEIIGMSPTDIRAVEATYFWFGEQAQMDAGADEFLGYIATLPYEGATSEKARALAQANEAGETTFGAATYTMTTAGTGLARILEISGS